MAGNINLGSTSARRGDCRVISLSSCYAGPTGVIWPKADVEVTAFDVYVSDNAARHKFGKYSKI
jgi:hypothetical protein